MMMMETNNNIYIYICREKNKERENHRNLTIRCADSYQIRDPSTEQQQQQRHTHTHETQNTKKKSHEREATTRVKGKHPGRQSKAPRHNPLNQPKHTRKYATSKKRECGDGKQRQGSADTTAGHQPQRERRSKTKEKRRNCAQRGQPQL